MGLLCRHEAERLEQEVKGYLERQKIMDEAEAERARKELTKLQAHGYIHMYRKRGKICWDKHLRL